MISKIQMPQIQKIQKITIHTFGWLTFLLLPLISGPHGTIFDDFHIGPPETRGLISSVLLVLFFYFNFYLLIPEFFNSKKYFWWGVIIMFSFFVILIVPGLLVPDIFKDFHGKPPHGFDQNLPPFEHRHPHEEFDIFRQLQFQETLLKFILILVLSTFFRLNLLWKKSREEKQNAELNYLKSQVSPHFLYNTLNVIYAQALENSPDTPDTIVKLSEVMRYVTTEIKNDLVTIQSEILQLQNYIDLLKLRFADTVQINFNSDISTCTDIKVPPLLFLPILEVAVSNGVIATERNTIDITVRTPNVHKLSFQVNFKQVNDSLKKDDIRALLSNVSRRLELEMNDSHQLEIDLIDSKCSIELILKF